MMNTEQRKKLLSHLAEKAEQGTSALEALKKEATNIATALTQETAYENLKEQLSLLGAIWYRVPEQTIEMLTAFLERLKTYKFNSKILSLGLSGITPLTANDDLIKKVLELLAGLRYFDNCFSTVLDILFQYSIHPEERIAKKAQEGIKAMADYNLEVDRQINVAPQIELLEKMSSFDDATLRQHFSTVEMACQEMLSPTMESTSWSYNQVTWHTGTVPTHEGTQKVRSEAITLLKRLYPLASNISKKKQVLGAIESVARTPNHELDSIQREAYTQDTITMLEWLHKVATIEPDMLILQQIEHDAYWTLRRSGGIGLEREPIRTAAFAIRDMLDANEEYKIFRVLIGFQGVFRDWEAYDDRDYEIEQQVREEQALSLAQEVIESTFAMWEARILEYTMTQSDDLATFPYFGKFLEHFGKLQPVLAVKLLESHADALERFSPSILFGVTTSNHKQAAYELMKRWCDAGQHLFRLAVFLQYSIELDESLLSSILQKATETGDVVTLSQIIATVSTQYEKGGESLISKFFMPALEELGKHDTGWRWVHGFWYQKHRRVIAEAMDSDQQKAVVDNLVAIPKVDYYAEEILFPIAEKSPDLVLDFFCDRLKREEEQHKDDPKAVWQDRYEAIPFSLEKLAEPLAANAALVLEKILPTSDMTGYVMFIYRGGRLIHNIFPQFSSELEQALIELVHKGGEKNWLYVLAILRNYKGEEFIHPVCKELVKAIPENDELLVEVRVALQSEGVVHGEYGMAESYERKAKELFPWTEDTDSKVSTFAEKYISQTEEMAKYQRKRADEDIALRKHQYGADEAEE
jgi:hypothetical protein